MEPVDLALCLAIDVSASIDYDEFGLMLGGTAAAFRDGEVVAACLGGPRGAVAVAAVFWSSAGPPQGGPEVAVPWMRVDSLAAAAALAEALEAAPRLPQAGATALGQGMAAGLALLARCPAEATRLVLDVSGDGRHNQGRAPGPVRDIGVAAGVTINGLAVLNEEPDLLDHYRAEVIGGPGSFAVPCADYADFAAAIRAKLLREIGGLLLSGLDAVFHPGV
ncbi:DUF1194 domain-containing protein [Paeniroseomonas aquatica]|uniref:DUF1194 domain-containing protein n=1 Tax=Paeniroseomonas aquatica TaxID=373043 RepID=A0ABT8A425_9PROT|nr:DUF1194 domain-containing protein [Paeniroseomonas aquatica]MDN3564489.1 DUF1194 domain-containing protein [Paeniroseomonas aquatica]